MVKTKPDAHVATNWLDFYGFKFNPFSPSPLRYQEEFGHYFVKTSDVTQFVDPILVNLEKSEPRSYLIGGERGIGKSTILYYIFNAVASEENFVPITCDLIKRQARQITPGTDADAEYHLGEDIVAQIIERILTQLIRNQDIATRNTEAFSQIAKVVGFEWKKFGDELAQIEEAQNYGTLIGTLNRLFGILQTENKRAFIIIDNIDVADAKAAFTLLGGKNFQPLIEMITKHHSWVVVSIGPLVYKKVREAQEREREEQKERAGIAGRGPTKRAESDAESSDSIGPTYSYLDTPISLTLNPKECAEIITRRLGHALEKPEHSSTIFVKDALVDICISSSNVTRKALDFAERCMILGAAKGQISIDLTTTKEVKESESVTERNFLEVIEKNDLAKDGYRKLLNVQLATSFDAFNRLIQTLRFVYSKKVVSKDNVDEAREYGFVTYGGKGKDYVVDRSVEGCFNAYETAQKPMLDEFIRWISREPPQEAVVLFPTEVDKRNRITERFRELLANLVHLELVESIDIAAQSYDSLILQYTSGNWEAEIVSRRISMTLEYTTRADAILHQLVDQNKSAPTIPTSRDLEEFVQAELREIAADWTMVVGYCRAVNNKAEVDRRTLETHVIITQRILTALLEYARSRVLRARELSRAQQIITTSEAELGIRIARYLGLYNEDSGKRQSVRRYIIVLHPNLPPSSFLLVGWPFEGSLFAQRYGQDSTPADEGVEGLEWPIPKFTTPYQGLPPTVRSLFGELKYQYSLKFVTSAELIRALRAFATKGQVRLKILSEKETVQLDVEVEGEKYVGKFMITAPDMENPFSERVIVNPPDKIPAASNLQGESQPKEQISEVRKNLREVLETKGWKVNVDSRNSINDVLYSVVAERGSLLQSEILVSDVAPTANDQSFLRFAFSVLNANDRRAAVKKGVLYAIGGKVDSSNYELVRRMVEKRRRSVQIRVVSSLEEFEKLDIL